MKLVLFYKYLFLPRHEPGSFAFSMIKQFIVQVRTAVLNTVGGDRLLGCTLLEFQTYRAMHLREPSALEPLFKTNIEQLAGYLLRVEIRWTGRDMRQDKVLVSNL